MARRSGTDSSLARLHSIFLTSTELLGEMKTNKRNKTVPEAKAVTCRSCAATTRVVTIVVVFAVSMLLSGCEYAIPLSISRHARKIQATLNQESASSILQKYLAGDDGHGLIGFDYESDGNEWLWLARGGKPIRVTVAEGVVAFEAAPGKDFKRFKKSGKRMNLPYEDVTPSWFANSKFEISLRTVRGVVFWDRGPIPNMPRERTVELQWSDPELDWSDPRRPPGARSGTLTLHVQEGNNDELIAALRYFSPTATFTAAR